MYRKVFACLMIVMLFISSSLDNSYALVVKDNLGVVTELDSVKFIKQHDGFTITGGTVVLMGQNLDVVSVVFESDGQPNPGFADLTNGSSDSVLYYSLSAEEAKSFTGKIYIGDKQIDLNTPRFPNIRAADKAAVNQDLNHSLTLAGSNLDLINNTDIRAVYGIGLQNSNITDNADVMPNSIKFEPTAPSSLGLQDIRIEQKISNNDPQIEVSYVYNDAFRIIESLPLGDVALYPNAASKGDLITLTSDNFTDSINYAVYFLDTTDGDFALTPQKKSPSVVLSADKKRLNVEVPSHANTELGSKRIVVVNVVNDQVISRFDVEESFSLIDAAFKPLITVVNPNEGSDEGADVQIIGRNLIKPEIPELNSESGNIVLDEVSTVDGNREMIINYDETGLTYKHVAVSDLTRKIRTYIAKQTFYQQAEDGAIKYDQIGADDYLYIKTDIVDDAATDPVKDVVVEIDTIITDENGVVYTFNQSAVVPNGYEFIPNSIAPAIQKVTPPVVHIQQDSTAKDTTLISIEGNNFFVDKYTDESGTVHTNYPVVLLQLTETLGDGDAIVKFDKNDKTGSPKGTITDTTGVLNNLPVTMEVLNARNEVVDGSVGNNIGTRIVLYIPETVNIGSAGKKNIQVINTKRNSTALGRGAVAIDIIDFVISNDTPIIESLEPTIITSDSREEIVVKGTNFQDGVKVYIDGIDVGSVARDISAQGDSATLTFKAPTGRVGKTQLQVVNPSGGTAVRDFYYVQSYNQDPSLDSISPDKGTADSLAIITGDNFLKPDAGAETSDGLDAYRLLGTRVLLDGVDVNSYNLDSLGEIQFVPYRSVAGASQAIFELKNDKIVASPYYKNATIVDRDNTAVYKITFGADGNPQLYDGMDVVHSFKYHNGAMMAYDNQGNLQGDINVTSASPGAIVVNSSPQQAYKVLINNHLIRADYNLNRELITTLADYANSVILYSEETDSYYTLQQSIDGTVRLSDGQYNVFTVRATGQDIFSPALKAFDKASNAYAISQSREGLTVALPTPLKLKMLTPFKIDDSTKQIVGNRLEIVSKSQIKIRIPNLTSGSGYKDVTVINPDTKSATLTDGYYYHPLPATKPIISYIKPNFGSVDGGYLVTITGRDFNAGTQVFFDGIRVAPADKQVSLDGTELQVKVPSYPLDISEQYGIDHLSVAVSIVNSDGGSASLDDGFSYVKPKSFPKLTQLILADGSTNGGEVVEIIGEDFRFFEPYENLGGSVYYEPDKDRFTNLNGHLPIVKAWDDLLETRYKENVDLWEEKSLPDGKNYYGYDYYYSSPILPKVYFGGKLAKIVEFANGYIKVITPPHSEGNVPVSVVNNDAGTSNTLDYNYQSSAPDITQVNPAKGARYGGEQVELVGEQFAESTYRAYQNNNADQIVTVTDKVDTLIKFGDISNRDIALGEENDGRINANRATVRLQGGLTVSYDGTSEMLRVSLQEGGRVYSREFINYDASEGAVYLPTGMLYDGKDYYQPTGYGYEDSATYNENFDYEWIEVDIDQTINKFIVTRGFSPRVSLQSADRITLKTPAYYTTDQVDITLYNPDGGIANASYQYTNPSSKPMIIDVAPFDVIAPNSVENSTSEEQKFVQGSLQGGLVVEIKAQDVREGVTVRFGNVAVEVIEIKENLTNGQTIIVRAPAADESLVDKKLAITIENPDTGTAMTTNKDKLVDDKRLIYFVYRKPLSLPVIEQIRPNKISQVGGVTIRVDGQDLRQEAKVNLGRVDSVTIAPLLVDEQGKYLEFEAPRELQPGSKDVQIVNSDFGTVTLQDALQVISDPRVDNKIFTLEDEPLRTIYTEGGQVIKIKGDNFQEGAQVIFGGERHLKSEVAAETEGREGFFRDHQAYILKGGIAATEVTFIDSHTLHVTTPPIAEEKRFSITVINPDSGISDGTKQVSYGVPVPTAPTSLKVDVVNGKYFKLYDYQTDNVNYYEIFVYIGKKSIMSLRNNKYRDFSSVGTTVYSPYKITRLNGLDEMSTSDRIYFMVKAVNQYGSSRYSNVAYLDRKDLTELKSLGGSDQDGNIADFADQIYSSELVDSDMIVNYSTRRFGNGAALNFSASTYNNMDNIRIVMPDKMIAYNRAPMSFKSDFINVDFTADSFKNDVFNTYNSALTEYVTWQTSWRQDAATSSARSKLPRGVRAISPLTNFNYSIENNMGQFDLGKLTKPINASLNLNSNKVTQKSGPFNVYYYNKFSRDWQLVESNYSASDKRVTFAVQDEGYFVLTTTY